MQPSVVGTCRCVGPRGTADRYLQIRCGRPRQLRRSTTWGCTAGARSAAWVRSNASSVTKMLRKRKDASPCPRGASRRRQSRAPWEQGVLAAGRPQTGWKATELTETLRASASAVDADPGEMTPGLGVRRRGRRSRAQVGAGASASRTSVRPAYGGTSWQNPWRGQNIGRSRLGSWSSIRRRLSARRE